MARRSQVDGAHGSLQLLDPLAGHPTAPRPAVSADAPARGGAGAAQGLRSADRFDPAELVARCALRDQRAFAQLYRYSAAKLYGVALRILRREDWAQEVLQESFINIWQHLPEYDAARSAPMTWMTAIVRNRSLDWLRRPRVDEPNPDYDLLVEMIADDAPSPEGLVSMGEDARALAGCMARLSARQRQLLTLAYLHGLSHSELARRLQQPLGTIKTWTRRALQELRACMESHGE
jgi:RNA polymerase sigma-70 factor (ECF subfamily)